MEGVPPVANQIDLFMHFLGAIWVTVLMASVEMDKFSSSEKMPCSIPPKKPLTDQSHIENEHKCLCDPLDGRKLNS